MYTSLPAPQRGRVRLSLGVAWLALLFGGAAGAIVSPQTIATEIGTAIQFVSSLVVVGSATFAFAGVAVSRYTWEWIGAWFAGVGLIPYVGTIWWLAFTSAPTRMQQACYVSALLLFCIYRIASCSGHAARIRSLAALSDSIGATERPTDG